MPTSSDAIHIATRTPSSPPAIATSKLSVITNRISDPRVAPNDNRIAISFCRAAARVISKLAMFTHAISSNVPTIASNT